MLSFATVKPAAQNISDIQDRAFLVRMKYIASITEYALERTLHKREITQKQFDELMRVKNIQKPRKATTVATPCPANVTAQRDLPRTAPAAQPAQQATAQNRLDTLQDRLDQLGKQTGLGENLDTWPQQINQLREQVALDNARRDSERELDRLANQFARRFGLKGAPNTWPQQIDQLVEQYNPAIYAQNEAIINGLMEQLDKQAAEHRNIQKVCDQHLQRSLEEQEQLKNKIKQLQDVLQLHANGATIE
jgi:hypothetical protein